ncbi:MAG TPA: hypothetical protein VFK07_03400 [Candidatus Paceibacterota bacterium]|nr:hypothetical protein [Candidatus Paceibacterota bacterium]
MLCLRKNLILGGIILAALLPWASARADVVGESQNFFVNRTFDSSQRAILSASLEIVGQHAYYYVDQKYLDALGPAAKASMLQELNSLSNEFDSNIYPKETAFWGSEANPGVDNDPRITILLESLKSGTGGYFDSVNGYLKSQVTGSNQREMLVLNSDALGRGDLNAFLAHEMQHLISFNQKELTSHVSEETWLNELRSQYAITIAGYDEPFVGSDLQERALTFLNDPTDSLTEWPNTDQDYASVTLFGQYLVGHFGPAILTDTLHSSLVGIDSINDWLATHGHSERFGDLFADWELANYRNDTSVDPLWGYTQPALSGLKVRSSEVRFLNFPTSASYQFSLKPWQPEWYQFAVSNSVPSEQGLQISWTSPNIAMLYYDNLGRVQEIANPSVIGKSSELKWFVLMPVNSSKLSDFSANDPSTAFSLNLSFTAALAGSSDLAISPVVHDGSLIKHASAPDIYVVEGGYKRRLDPAVLPMYGFDASTAVTVPESVFESYKTSNYIRPVDGKQVYAVWPDGTKHWLNMSAATFNDSGRDWNSIFIVNDLENNFYKTGSDIRR